eukprot:CAMPEP_0113598738 /NCGR_PEP_ID=MMETSP0015_2-20120614/41758_1 /TAXON_ID=2838 /ORGANISM="Odontella" /LENGTH=390 /DNA_ID=CAMNT_0000506797 /DNA_START=131 /DNA_END=1304 /DNA_ORIENTATION=- /assembly_acc=CAM_ASM_000160
MAVFECGMMDNAPAAQEFSIDVPLAAATLFSPTNVHSCSEGAISGLERSGIFGARKTCNLDGISVPLSPGFNIHDRRLFLDSMAKCAAASSIAAFPLPLAASAYYVEPNIDCLRDLPPPSPDTFRVYLCRHGETENNRLHIYQGVRVNAPLNGRGFAQSERLGIALSRLDADLRPAVIVHSGMTRSKQTAVQAMEAMVSMETAAGLMGRGSRPRRHVRLEHLPSLRSVDYGPFAGGREASEVVSTMGRTVGAWTSGYIDTRPDGGGESGREVLNRGASALKSLAKLAGRSYNSSGKAGSIVAVSHSSYIRILLSLVLGIPLEKASTLPQENGCINVVDIFRGEPPAAFERHNTIFYENPKDFELQFPLGKVERMNEVRHFGDICRFIPRG